MVWTKTGRTVNEGCATVTYAAEGTPYTIESRKRPIPHANGRGSWDYTSYFVLKNGEELMEKQRLGDAKEFAERSLRLDELGRK